MEGGADLVAVVRWLSDAGLAFCLLNNNRVRRSLERQTASHPPARNPSYAVASQTLSEHRHRSPQLLKQQYTSTYQESHCGVNAGSPACWHTEYPPQRQRPSSAFGNFEVGSSYQSRSPARTDIAHRSRVNRDPFGSTGRQLRQQERYVEAFVSSLRKYPTMTERSPRTELLEQLVKTSQTQSPEQSQAAVASKKRRHHWDKPRPLVSTTPYANRHKENHKRPRRKKTNTEINSKRKAFTLPAEPTSANTFDYLNSGARSSPGSLAKRMENKIFKNVFRELRKDKQRPLTAFPVCPNLQSRYQKHLKQYHPTNSKTPDVDFANLESCSKCLMKRPCPCEAARSFRRIDDKAVQEKRLLEEAIFSWLNDIPVYPNENPHDKLIRDAIVKKLAESFSSLDDRDFDTEGKDKIKQALDKMPMWYPKETKERDEFKNKIADNLLEKIRGIKKIKKFNQTIQNFFNRLKFVKDINTEKASEDIIAELDKIALDRPENNDTYRDLLKMKAFELLDKLPIKTSGNKYEYLNQLSDELADRLSNVSTEFTDAEYEKDLVGDLKNMLDETNVFIKDRQKVEDNLRAIIADVVAQNIDKDKAETYIKNILDGKVPDSEIENITQKTLMLVRDSQDIIQIDPETTRIIIDDIGDILDTSGLKIKDRNKIEESLRTLVSNIVAKGIDEDKAETQIKALLKGKLSGDQLNNISDRVLEFAAELSHATQLKPLDQQTQQLINENLSDIIEHFGDHIKNKATIRDDLNKLVPKIVAKDMDREKAKSEIKVILKGNVSKDKLEDILNEVLALVDHVKQIQMKSIDEEINKYIKEDINTILNVSGAQIKDRGKVEEKLHKIINSMITKGTNEDDIKTQITSLLKGKVSKDKLEDVADQLLELGNQVKPIDLETKQIIKKDVHDILDLSGVQIKNKGKIAENLSKLVADITTKGIEEEKVTSQIKSLLKGLPEDKVENITEQVLTLADRVKPIDHETKQIIKEDIRDILDLSGVQIRNRGQVEENLSKIVADITSSGMEGDKAKSRIQSILKGKVSEDNIEDITDQVLTLANRVKPIDNETKHIIKKDVHDILDLSGVQIKNKGKIAENLSKLVADITTKGIEEEKVSSQIKSLLKGLPEDKVENITEQVLKLASQLKTTDTKQTIKDNIHDMFDLSGAKIKNRKKVEENLSKLVAEITTSGIEEEKARIQIQSLLKANISEDKLDGITEQVLTLAGHGKPINHETRQNIKEDVRNILNQTDSPIKNREKVEDNLCKLVDEITIKGMGRDKAEAQIKSLLKGNVSENKLKDITKQVLTLAEEKKRIDAKPIDPDTRQRIHKSIRDILDISIPNIKDKNKFEEKLSNLVSNILSKQIGKDNAKRSIKSILKGKVPEDSIEDIIIRILELIKNIEATVTMDYSKSQETLKEDISDILDHTSARIKNRSKVEESLRDILSDLIMRGIDKRKAQDYIYSTLKGNVPDSQVEDISKKMLALAEQPSPSLSEYSGGPVAHSTQNEEKIFVNQINEIARDWLKNRDILLSNKKLNEVAEAIVNEILDRQKYLQLNPEVTFSEAMELEILKEQIYKVLNKLIDKNSVQIIMSDVENLIRSLKQNPYFKVNRDSSKEVIQDSIQFVQENLEGALLDWLRNSPIYINRTLKDKQSQEQIILKLARSLATVLSSNVMQKPGTNPDEILLKEITKHIEGLPLDPKFKSKEYISKLASHLLDYLKNLKLFQDISARDSHGTLLTTKGSQRASTSFMSSTNHLNYIVKDWCEALQLLDVDGAFQIKQDLAHRLILKIGEMNMNQDIFNDDLLYDEILHDFIDQQLLGLPIDNNITDASINVLLNQIKQVKQKVQDDFIGRKYKQKLRDTISNVFPSIACPTAEDLTSFELMKENLADAFINLNYSGDDERAKIKFKRRIMDEVNKYVNDYLGRCPETPIDSRKLNENLYKALKNVPVPTDESMRTEVESVRMKDVINDWLKTLPMSKHSIPEQLHAQKVVALMAQKLQELETEFLPDFEEIAVTEIASYLKKLPLKNKNNLQGMAKKLIDKIKNTAESRAFVEGTRSTLSDDCLCKDFPIPHSPLRTRYPACTSVIPPCGLSKEDQEMMKRIRERSFLCEAGTQSRRCKDAAVNPQPLDHGSQTEMPCHSKWCQHADRSEHVCSKSFDLKTKRIPIGTRPCPSAVSQTDLSPYVLVKEYYWDSSLGKKADFETQTPPKESEGVCIRSSPKNSERICRPRPSLTPRGISVEPRSRPEVPVCRRRIPKRQISSACPTEYFRPKRCPRSPSIPESDYLRRSCRRVWPSCSRTKSPCLSCQGSRTTTCHKCFPAHVCPHPTCL